MMDRDGPMWLLVIEVLGAVQTTPEVIRKNVQVGTLQRALCEAMGAEYDSNRIYDGEMDSRVFWVREVIDSAREGKPTHKTPGWPLLEFMLDQHVADLRHAAEKAKAGRG